MTRERWTAGHAYEGFVGRWSRLVAAEFLLRLDVPDGGRWLDVGCGTGALAAAVVAAEHPAWVVGVDPALPFLIHARSTVTCRRCVFVAGDAQALPMADASVDAVVSGLAVNFVPAPHRAVAEFARVAAPGATVAAYVWDYAEGMSLLRHFWDAAKALDPHAAALDEATRFPVCRPDPLRQLWHRAGLTEVSVEPIDVATVFSDFADLWRPFLGGQCPAPGYVATLPDPRRRALADLLEHRLAPDGGPVVLTARAWAVLGRATRTT